MRYRRAPRATIAAFMDHEIERQRQLRVAREPFDTPQIRSADVNAARRRAAAIFDTRLDPIARYEWEGWHPNDTDPLWPVLFARARDEVSWIQPTAAVPTLSLLAADLAHEWLRAIARATPTMRREKVV